MQLSQCLKSIGWFGVIASVRSIMSSKLLSLGSHAAKNELECSLKKAFEELEPKLRPPFALRIPDSEEYSKLNQAILFGVLTEPHFSKTHIKHLHAIVTDGYAFFVSLFVRLVNESYGNFVSSVKNQLIWVAKEMIRVLGVGFDGLLVCLLRQIIGGDFSEENLWLCFEMVTLLMSEFHCLVEEEPLVLTSGLYVYLRLLADHCRLCGHEKIECLKQLEIEFCVKMLRDQFHLSMKVGRDLVRLLQDLVHVPEFRAVWKDLVLNPNEFRTAGFSDISQLYGSRTSSRYFLLRITPEMETQIRFLLTHVKFGSQKRYQMWFANKFLLGTERQSIVVDIVRFICCAHHPSNETIQSDIIPRWAVIGWLLRTCRKNHVEANAKLALFYDWLFFDGKVDNVMNIEPAMLLMLCSIPEYVDMTHNLLEFLLLLVDNYDVDRNHVILSGVSSTFSVLVQKGVIHSLEVLTSSHALSPSLKEGLGRLLLRLNMGVSKEVPITNLLHHSVPPLELENMACLETPAPSSKQHSARMLEVRPSNKADHTNGPVSDKSVIVSRPSAVANKSQVDNAESLIRNIVVPIKKS